MKKKQERFSKIDRLLEMPQEVYTDTPKIIITGFNEMIIENFKGILEYEDYYIRINTSLGIVNINGFELKLENMTNDDIKVNGKVEMCGMNKGTWIRVKGAVKEDTRREARVAMMEANKNALQSMYMVDDNLMTVFVFESGIATIYSFTEEPKAINL